MSTRGNCFGRGATRLGQFVLLAWVAVHAVEAASPRDDLVFFTDDKSGREPGCDRISVYDVGGDDATELYRGGPERLSPGRLTAREDLSLIISQNSNDIGLGIIDGKPRGGHLRLLWDFGRDAWPRWKTELVVPENLMLSQLGAPLLLPDGFTLLCPVELAGPVRNGPTATMLMRFDIAEIKNGQFGRSHGALPVAGLVVGQYLDGEGRLVHLLTTGRKILTIDPMTMRETAAPIDVPAFSTDVDKSGSRFPERFMHGVLSSDRRLLLSNLGFSDKLFVADLETRRGWSISIPNVGYVGGLDISRGPANEGLLAMHLGDATAVFSFEPPATLTELARKPVFTDWSMYEPLHSGFGDGFELVGPATSIAWASGGRKLVVAHAEYRFEPFDAVAASTFRTYIVEADGRELRPAGDLVGCGRHQTVPNDILTYNSLFPPPTPPPLSTASEPTQPTPEPSVSPSATATTPSTQAPTATSTATLSPTATPAPLLLPLLLAEPPCRPQARPLDAALVLDASNSMTGAKLAAAQAAARAFAGDLAPGKDRLAIVSFHREAQLLAPLAATPAQVEAAIAGIQPSAGTRLDRGLAVALAELLGGARPEAATALILLTDGRQDEDPEAALRVAEGARAAGIQVHAVGFGQDADLPFLARLAPDPGAMHRAEDAAALVDLYRRLAVVLPCGGSRGWSGR